MPFRPDIEIAVPTHNCGPWFDEFVQSVLTQVTANSWRIVLRDDVSTDATPSRIEHWRGRLVERLKVVSDSGQVNLGMVGNYDAVLAATSARWVMFADPDDVWLPGKMDLCVRAMREAESAYGESTPLIVCSDAQVVDQDLHEIARSYWRWSRMNPALANTFHRLLMESPVLTSTMMVNRALLDLALPMSGAASCPDWWPALVACAFGRIIVLKDTTILYRRHSTNDSLDPAASSLLRGAVTLLSTPNEASRRLRRILNQISPQALNFGKRYQSRLTGEHLNALNAAASLEQGRAVRRAIIREALWFGSPIKNVGLMLFA